MGAKLSAEMIRARGLVAAGLSAAEAARSTGMSKGAISQDPVCRKHIEAARNATMRKVHDMVRKGVTRKGACAEYGVTESGYSKFLKRQREKENVQTVSQGA